MDANVDSCPDMGMNLLVTNHAQVLACVARNPSARLRDVAESVGLTERAVQRLVNELESAGFLRRAREGRRNRYEVAAEPLQQLARSLATLANELQPGTLAPSGIPAGPPGIPVAPLADGRIARNLSFID